MGEDSAAHLALLRQSARPEVAAAIERLLRDGSDRELCRVNALAFAGAHGLDEGAVLAGFLHAARLGLFELGWNVLCPSCGGVVHGGATLKTVDRPEYRCSFCLVTYEATLDEIVAQSARLLQAHGLAPAPHEHLLRGLASEVTIDQIG